mmetsp:Transcript_1746/g.2999  ORF Transcript_1746/g.2999 Transcript_1746/m.2999 type:complete len:267 (+) Transcript_1746:739-1539(+)
MKHELDETGGVVVSELVEVAENESLNQFKKPKHDNHHENGIVHQEMTYEQGNNTQPKAIITGLCRLFYSLGWCTGTGGGLSIRENGRIYLAPSGVQKERMREEDIFVLDSETKQVLEYPVNLKLKMSACKPLFFLAFDLRNAGACLHSHSVSSVVLTAVLEKQGKKEFRVTHLEMIKGIEGLGYRDTLVVPIIDNTPFEHELEDSMKQAMLDYPDTKAILVKRHGVYVWGKTWEQAKAHAECLDYLFNAAVELIKLGIDPAEAPKQ